MTLVLMSMTMTIIYADDYSMTVDHQLVIGDGDNGTTITMATEMAKMMIGVKNNWFLSKNFKPVSLHTLYFDSRPTVSTFYILYFIFWSQASSEHIFS